MFVRDYMTRHPLMAEPTMSIVEAQRYMGENNIRHLPIVGDGKRLLGLVTRQTLLVDPGRLGSLDVWEITRFLSRLTVKDIMIKARDVITKSQDATIEEAARLMITQRIGCLPVVRPGLPEGNEGNDALDYSPFPSFLLSKVEPEPRAPTGGVGQ